MNDREMLEYAAKAAGYTWSNDRRITHGGLWITAPITKTNWNPRDNDGDAFRLAVKLCLSVKHGVDLFDETNTFCAFAYFSGIGECAFIPHRDDPYAATRRAIVWAAAEIGKQMALQELNNAAEKNGETL